MFLARLTLQIFLLRLLIEALKELSALLLMCEAPLQRLPQAPLPPSERIEASESEPALETVDGLSAGRAELPIGLSESQQEYCGWLFLKNVVKFEQIVQHHLYHPAREVQLPSKRSQSQVRRESEGDKRQDIKVGQPTESVVKPKRHPSQRYGN